MIYLKVITLFVSFLLKNIFTENQFIFHPVYEGTLSQHGTYIRPITSEDGNLYIITGEDVPKYSIRNRYIIKYNINSGNFVEQIKYKSNYGFWRGEATVAGDNSEYLIMSTFGADEDEGHSFEFFNLQKSKLFQTEYKVYGYRRTLRKAGSYYYYIYLDPDNKKEMIINKIKLIYNYGDDFPSYEIIQSTNIIKALYYQAMVSCDFTKNNNYILCAYFSEEYKFSLSLFNSNLNLLQTKILERLTNITECLDNLIKIVYFKDNAKFVIMNSEDKYITRFRYFSYTSNNLKNELLSIISRPYLDIEETQISDHDGSNDIVTDGSNRIIKISSTDITTIIITIIQFYENDSYFSIKIYNMYNNNGFTLYSQPRIAMFRNSFIVCMSALKDDLYRGGYFFINFPNSTDTTLSSNIIKLQNLISIENNLFSLNKKFKVISIPKDFIFINTLNSLEIKNNDVLDISNELKLKQYRIKEGTFILKYEGIAVGTDSGYRYMKIYPENKIVKTQEVYIEGRQGSIKINFNDCLDGYYKLDYDLNLCTNVKPKGYYLDKVNKIYKACSTPCSECSGPKISENNMNCLECINNFYMTEDTNSCYNKVIDNYYLDNNILRRCHSNCKRCTSKAINENYMNCLECINNYYMTEDKNSCYNKVIDHYYLDNNILRRCHSNCKRCTSKAINESNMNCLECINNYYMTEDTNSCYNKVIDNYYLDNNILRRCHSNCKRCSSKAKNNTFMNCLECQNNLYLTEDTNSCYSTVLDNYYLDNNILRRCHSDCKKCISKSINITFMNCFECKDNYYMTEDTNSCYNNVIDNYFLNKNILRRCHPRCKRCNSIEINEDNMNCIECQNIFYLTEDTSSCYENIIDNYFLDNNKILRRCHSNCKRCTSKPINETYMNCSECINNYYMTEDTNSCHNKVIDNYYLDNNILRRCHPKCKRCSSKEINNTFMNCLNCIDNFYLTEDTNSCYDQVIENYYLDNDTLRRCHERCKWCTGPKNNEQMNCIECLNNETHTYFYQNDTTNCLLDSEFQEREIIVFSILQNYNFYIYLFIFIISFIISFFISYIFNCHNGDRLKEANNERVEMTAIN